MASSFWSRTRYNAQINPGSNQGPASDQDPAKSKIDFSIVTSDADLEKGIQNYTQREYSQGLDGLESVYRFYQAHQNIFLTKKASFYIALIHKELGNYEQAENYLKECLHYNEESDDAFTGITLFELALCYKKQNRPQLAKDYFQNAMPLLENIPSYQKFYIYSHLYCGEIFAAEKNYQQAGIYYQKANKLFKMIADTVGLAEVNLDAGIMYCNLGRFDEARKRLENAKQLIESAETQDEILLSDIYQHLGICYLNLNAANRAIPYLEQAKKIYNEHSYDSSAAVVSFSLGICYSVGGQIDKAITNMQETLSSLKSFQDLDKQELNQIQRYILNSKELQNEFILTLAKKKTEFSEFLVMVYNQIQSICDEVDCNKVTSPLEDGSDYSPLKKCR